MIYDDYIDIHRTHVQKYGANTMLFMQVGDFFEIYAVQNEHEKVGADIFVLADLCNLQVTRKNKSIPDVNRSNPYMAGFPLHALQKHVQTLIANQYTVVVVRQVTPPPNVKREITEIYSPSTFLQTSSPDTNYLMVFMWDSSKRVGITGIELSTGHTWIYEAGASSCDPAFAMDEAQRILHAYQPKEVVVLSSAGKDTKIDQLFDSNRCCVHKRWNDYDKMIDKPAFQNAMISKSYATANGVLSPLENLGIECFDLARTAFTFMLQFAYEHNDHIIQKLMTPNILSKETFLNLQHTSALQLNLIASHPSEKPLMHFLNRCATSFGSRTFRDRLLQPSQDKNTILSRYDKIGAMITDERYVHVYKSLSKVLDLERMARRVVIGSMAPMEWNALHESLESASLAFHDEMSKIVQQIRAFQSSYKDILNLEECNKYSLGDIQGNVFCHGLYIDIDQLTHSITQDMSRLEELAKMITEIGTGEGTLCRVDCNDRDGFFLSMTRKRYESAIKLMPSIHDHKFETKAISSTSSVLRVTNKEIHELSDRIIANKWKLQTQVTKRYKEFLQQFDVSPLEPIISEITEMDIAATCAKNAVEYDYCRPSIVENTSSSIHAREIRHPIIERIQDHIHYVKNDVMLNDKERGLLLYGINASGKSSYMKAIGLNLIMAQAGMYAAASSFEYTPFSHIFTRISHADNIYRGMSSFTMEMSELRNILQRCDHRSLVLGDELCAGTESTSALAIVGAGVKHLLEKQACFVFATHLHELLNLSLLKGQSGLGVYHMHIEIDADAKKIIYERTLKPGPGHSIYGLEVCDALCMPEAFLQTAHAVRREVQGVSKTIVTPKTSKYNAHVVMDTCKICGAKASEAHHIRYQQHANEQGFVEKGISVHQQCNIIPLCETCHDKQHHGEIHIEGYVQTSKGIEVKVATKKKRIYTLEDACKHFQGQLIYNIHGWKQQSKSNDKWRTIQECTVITKLEKLTGTQIEEEDIPYIRSSFSGN